MALPPPPDLKPIEQRQREIDELLRSKLPAEMYRQIADGLKMDRLKLLLIAALMGRDLWEPFWATCRDSVELEAEKMLAAREKPSSERGIFG
jgi:hypothetical protein